MLSASSTSTSSLRCSRQRTPFQIKAMERHNRICRRDGRRQEHFAERPACHKADHLFLIFLIDLPAVVGGDKHL